MKKIGSYTLALGLALALAIGHSSAQQTTTTGWMMYNDTVGRSLELTPDQEERMRDWDQRYEREVRGLGTDGVRHRDFQPLNDRRTNELQGILTPQQFERWNEMDRNRNWRSTNTTGGAPGPEMRRGEPGGTHRGIMDRGDGAGAGKDRGSGTELGRGTGTSIDRGAGVGTDGGTGTTGTGSATDGGNRNTVTPPTP